MGDEDVAGHQFGCLTHDLSSASCDGEAQFEHPFRTCQRHLTLGEAKAFLLMFQAATNSREKALLQTLQTRRLSLTTGAGGETEFLNAVPQG